MLLYQLWFIVLTTCHNFDIQVTFTHVRRITRSIQLSMESSAWTLIYFTILYNKSLQCSMSEVFSKDFCANLHADLYNVSIHIPMTIPWHTPTFFPTLSLQLSFQLPINILFTNFRTSFRHRSPAQDFLQSFAQVSTQTPLQHYAAAERPAGLLPAMAELSVQVLPVWRRLEDFVEPCLELCTLRFIWKSKPKSIWEFVSKSA